MVAKKFSALIPGDPFHAYEGSDFDVRKSNGSYLSWTYVPLAMKFTALVDGVMEKKPPNFQQIQGFSLSQIKLQEKKIVFTSKDIFFIRFIFKRLY